MHVAHTSTMVRLEFQQTMAEIFGQVLKLSITGTSGSSGGYITYLLSIYQQHVQQHFSTVV
jgi:hypothetical protein